MVRLGGSRGNLSLSLSLSLSLAREAKPPTRGKSMVGAALLNS